MRTSLVSCRCEPCGELFYGRSRESAGRAVDVHYWTVCRAGYRQRVAEQIRRDRWRIYRRLSAALPGWRIFASPQRWLEIETWYAAPVPAGMPPEVAARHPGCLSSNDPDMLLALCRTAQQQRRAA